MASLVFLILSAICVQSLSLLLQTKQYSYHSHPHYHGALYALGTLAAFHIAPQALHHPALQWSNPLALLWLSLTLATLAFNRYVPISLGYRLRHKKSYFLDFNLAFVLVKIGEQAFVIFVIGTVVGHGGVLQMARKRVSILPLRQGQRKGLPLRRPTSVYPWQLGQRRSCRW